MILLSELWVCFNLSTKSDSGLNVYLSVYEKAIAHQFRELKFGLDATIVDLYLISDPTGESKEIQNAHSVFFTRIRNLTQNSAYCERLRWSSGLVPGTKPDSS
ncbi:hypothetical protein AVEN_93536-1 [Araneus ventricosus]|uniref:Uncharacterized protein n=1 Tax=Araneus ventricosus TaxID=182803 RepID=A0A4Y2ARG9_ARAVE|nr:hypothetical protein AVEN_93536-1 [Araneus ventricosus]